MRFIDRDKLSPPEMLFDKRTDEARAEVQAFIDQTYSKGGTRRAPRSDWLDDDVLMRREMAERFGHVCAYCESPAPFDGERKQGYVSRHRPPMLAQDEDGNTDLLAYCWLMYDWENLLWVCPTCARLKGNKFFIEARRGQPGMSIKELRALEQEVMLDSCFHDPGDHLVFLPDGTVEWTSPAGHATSETLDLNRPELVASRRSAIQALGEALRSGGLVADGYVLSAETLSGPAEHAGAVTNALMRYAAAQGISAATVDALAETVNAMDPEDRRRFAKDFLSRAYDVDVEAVGFAPDDGFESSLAVQEDDTAPATRAPSRIPNIRKLPNATKPITRVEISNFKALKEIAFDLPDRVADADQSPCMLLLGENATGKSSVLEAMALAVIGTEEAAALDEAIDDEPLSPADLIHRPDPYRWAETTPGMAIRLGFLDSIIPAGVNARAGDARFSGDAQCCKVVLGYGPRRFFTKRKTRRLRAPAHRVRSLFDPMDMIANPILWLTTLEGKKWEATARALREVLMLSDDDDFERDDDPDTPGAIYVRQNGRLVAMKDLSVGYKSVIAMVCDIIREMLCHYDNLEFASAVVFIDEIETHLHPRWKMQIMTLLRRAFPRIQFIATTHDPLCLRGMYDGEVFVLQRSAEDQVERVEDLPSIRGMRAEQILTSEFFGLGSTDPETDARLERYNRLAVRIEDLSEAERAELDVLRGKLDDGMVLGSTLREQAYAEALKKQVGQEVAPTKVASPRRADLRQTFSALFEKRS
jgi:hypothetical protein